jgi:imidazolonepropionase-like amidohydrolase
MNRSVWGQRLRLVLRAVAFCGVGLWAVMDSAIASSDVLKIEHVTIVSPEREEPRRDATVTIRDARITSISSSSWLDPASAAPPQEVIIDGRGLYLTPGLIDSHVHLGEIPGMNGEQEARHPEIARPARDQMPRSFLLYGFTTLVDLVSTPREMAQWKSHDIVPDTYFCGGAALMDGYPMNFAPKPDRYHGMPYMLIEAGVEAPAGIDPTRHTPAAVVAAMRADGAICVKTFFERGFGKTWNLPVPRLETIRALVRAAHAAGLPVLMHANSSEAQAFGVDAGVDIIAHGLWNWNDSSSSTEVTPAVKSILDRVIKTKTGWQPTIQVLYGDRDLFDSGFLSNSVLARVLPSNLIDWYRSSEGQWFHNELLKDPEIKDAQSFDVQVALAINRVKRATRYLADRGANLLFGTDTPSGPTYANPPGLNAWFEMKNLIDAGLTPTQIFRAATWSNAQALHLNRDIGTVEVGKRANLLLLRQDPTKTIEAYADVVKVILGGRVLDPVQLAADHPVASIAPAERTSGP